VTTATDESVRLDLNSPVFQRQFFSLEKDQAWAVVRALKKLASMTWDQVYRDTGLKWEAVSSRKGPRGERLYTIRITRGFRGLACREASWLRVLSLHPDHDSAYDR
jgi:hypothetical protein